MPSFGAFGFGVATLLYEARRYEEAAAAFAACLAAYPDDGPSAALGARCRLYAADPPPLKPKAMVLGTEKISSKNAAAGSAAPATPPAPAALKDALPAKDQGLTAAVAAPAGQRAQ